MYEEGIVDPAKVTRSGLQNATSIASMILTTECIIVDDSKDYREGLRFYLNKLGGYEIIEEFEDEVLANAGVDVFEEVLEGCGYYV